jgi:hypothetical protein
VVDASVKDPPVEKKVGRKKGCPRIHQTPKGSVLLLQDIIRELNIKAALNEVSARMYILISLPQVLKVLFKSHGCNN